jgi:hypothetical protein
MAITVENNARVTTTTRTVHTLHIDISNQINQLQLSPDDHVEVVFQSQAMNREPSPIRLSYATLQRLTRDA